MTQLHYICVSMTLNNNCLSGLIETAIISVMVKKMQKAKTDELSEEYF